MSKELSKKDQKIVSAMWSDASDKIISLIETNLGTKATDVKKLDEYFIFTSGENSVLHFHLDNCPGWKFGIWWDEPEKVKQGMKKVVSDYVRGTLFAQYEETIDKFKPSASQIASEFWFCSNDNYLYCAIENIIKFISSEPALAFCRDYHYWDYNTQYHSREEAEEEFEKYKIQHEKEVRINKECDEKILNYVRENILPLFKDSEIVDHGDCWAPRYEVYAKFESNTDLVSEPGCYSWFNNEDEDERKAQEKYQEYEASLKKYAEDNDVWWWCCIDEVLEIYKEGAKPLCEED